MKAETSMEIRSTKEKIWEVITDIEHAESFISGIDRVKILNSGDKDFVGFEWKETRTMYGKEASETMVVTKSKPYVYYDTRAESHGAVYLSRTEIMEKDGSCILKMKFIANPVSVSAKIMYAVFAKPIAKSMVKAFTEDLVDIRNEVEKRKKQR